MRTVYTWSAITAIVLFSTAGDVLLAYAMRNIGDLGDIQPVLPERLVQKGLEELLQRRDGDEIHRCSWCLTSSRGSRAPGVPGRPPRKASNEGGGRAPPGRGIPRGCAGSRGCELPERGLALGGGQCSQRGLMEPKTIVSSGRWMTSGTR